MSLPATSRIQCETIFLEHCLGMHHLASAPPSRSCIIEFVMHVQEKHSSGKDVEVCAKADGRYATSAAVLVGSYMILSDGFGLDEVLERLSTISGNFVSYDDGIGLVDCLTAIQHSKDLGWLDTPCIGANLEYDQAAETMHSIIPGRLLFCPNHITEMASRIDQESGCLSAASLAIALADLDVCLVLRIGLPHRPVAIASTLQAQGIAVEDLLLDGGVHLIHTFDTLLTIVRNAPRPMAVEGAVSSVAPLLAACLMKEADFAAGAAMAWVRMARPAPPCWITAGTLAGAREVGGMLGACKGRDAPPSRARRLAARTPLRSRSCTSVFAA